jgi:hypothetical protein
MPHGGAAEAIANAIKASGVVVQVRPPEFNAILKRAEKPLVIRTVGGIFSTNYHYLISYKGFVFYTKSAAQLILPPDAEVVEAGKIWIPNR